MYDAVIRSAVLDRLGEFLSDLIKHPGKGLLVVGGMLLVIWWLTRK